MTSLALKHIYVVGASRALSAEPLDQYAHLAATNRYRWSALLPATKQPEQRNPMMIAAHIVWGAALGAVTASATASENTGSIRFQEQQT